MAALPKVFVDRMKELMESAGFMSRAVVTPGVLKRLHDVTDQLIDVDAQDRFFWIDSYRRDALNSAYKDAVDAGNDPTANFRAADVQVNKAAIDYLAALERSAHAANASRIRCNAWAAARRKGQALQYGSFDVIVRDLQERLTRGYSLPIDPSA